MLYAEGGFFVVRFYSREDYTHVLEGRPWIVMGHYLSSVNGSQISNHW